jgi:hypothetical protein
MDAIHGVTYIVEVYSNVSDAMSVPVTVNCTAVLGAANITHTTDVMSTSLSVYWLAPVGYFNGFTVKCHPSNLSKEAINTTGLVYSSSGSAPYTYNCTGLTAGALYEISVATFLNQSATSPVMSSVLHTVTYPYPPQISLQDINESALSLKLSYPHKSNEAQCSTYRITISPPPVFPLPSVLCQDTSVTLQ